MEISEFDTCHLQDEPSKEYFIYTKEHKTPPYTLIADGMERYEDGYHFYVWEEGLKEVLYIFNKDFVNYILIKDA